METINKAREVRSTNIYHALTLYRKGINELLNERKSDEAVNSLLEYAELISTLKGVLGFDEVLNEAAIKFEEFKQYYEAGQIYTALANLYYRLEIYGESAYLYEKAAKNFLQTQLKKSHEIASACFAKSSECYELIKMRRKAELTLKKGVFANTKKDVAKIEGEGFRFIDLKENNKAALKFEELANLYLDATDSLQTIIATSISGGLALSVKCRITEYTAIYNFLAAINNMLSNSKPIKIKENSLNAATFFKKSFFNYKGLLASGYKSKVDYLHASYNLMWALIIFSKYKIKDQVDEVIEELNNIPEKTKNSIRKNDYYRISEKIIDRGLNTIIEDITEANLGKLEKVKREILNYIS